MTQQPQPQGFSLAELLVTMAVLMLLSCLALVHAGGDQHRQRLELAARQFQLTINQARLTARRDHQACGLPLEALEHPADASHDLPPCSSHGHPFLTEAPSTGVTTHTNLPPLLRFSSNGLLLDAGLVVFSHPNAQLRPCVVVSLPLGVSREGRYDLDPAETLNSQHCLPSP